MINKVMRFRGNTKKVAKEVGNFYINEKNEAIFIGQDNKE